MNELIKKIAQQTQDASVPARLLFGIVHQSSPLVIRIGERLELSGPALVTLGHAQFETGDRLALLRDHGGQLFLVLGTV